jgi:hypothetical protein
LVVPHAEVRVAFVALCAQSPPVIEKTFGKFAGRSAVTGKAQSVRRTTASPAGSARMR